MQIHLEKVVGPNKISGGIGVRGWGGGRGSEIQKSEKAHVNTHAYSSTKGSRPIGGWGGGSVGGDRGSEIQVRKSTCEHTYTHAYSSTKGSRPNKN